MEDGSSVLTIKEVFPDDSGEIRFEAFNPLGVATTKTELLVEGYMIFDTFLMILFIFQHFLPS